MKDLPQRMRIAALVLIAGFCFWKAIPGLQRDKPLNSQAQASTVSADVSARTTPFDALTPPPNSRAGVTTPIQDLHVGMRVVGRNPLDEDAQRDLPQPEPATWRLVRARIEMEADKFCDMELLRPLQWIEITEAEPGATIWLDLPEMHVAGDAEVLAIEPCPPLETGTNPVITGTFRHLAPQVVDVHIAGSDQPIGCTPQHPFWSETHEDFVPASTLEPGEEVLTAYGNSARITTIVPRAGPQTVYGLEVYGEHVYHVGGEALLAHNASGKSAFKHTTYFKRKNAAYARHVASSKAAGRTPTGRRAWKNQFDKRYASFRSHLNAKYGPVQNHHLVTNKMRKALNKRGLNGQQLRDRKDLQYDSSPGGHVGYEKWHIAMDKHMVNYISTKKGLTENSLLREIHNYYQSPSVAKRIPDVDLGY